MKKDKYEKITDCCFVIEENLDKLNKFAILRLNEMDKGFVQDCLGEIRSEIDKIQELV